MKASAHYSWNLQVVTVPGVDTDLCIVVSTDTERYIIGAGENAQRSLDQSVVNHSRTTALIVGDGRGRGRYGLPGLTMRKLDENPDGLSIIGPPDLAHFLSTFRMSVYRYEYRVTLESHPPDVPPGHSNVIHKGDHITISSIALKPAELTSFVRPPDESNRDPWNLSFANLQSLLHRCVHTMFPQSKVPRVPNDETMRPLPLPMDEHAMTDMVYIFRGADIVGKFDNKKAMALKVPNRPIRAQLIAGETIEFPDPDKPGQTKVVRPGEVVGKTAPGPTLILVNCTPPNVDTLLASPAFDPYLPGGSQSSPIAVIHRIPEEVLADLTYRKWMARFDPKTKHLVANTSQFSGEINMRAGAWEMLKLSLLDEDLFQLPYSSSSSPLSDLPPNTSFLTRDSWLNIHPLEWSIPSSDRGDRPFPDTEKGIADAKSEYMARGALANAVNAARRAVRSDSRWNTRDPYPGAEITVTTLGTGSAFPTKMRNVSSTHLDVPGMGGLIFDAGEGTCGQLYRRFGPEGLKDVYQRLRLIFISHMHADHHLGLQSLLEDRFKHGVHSKLYIVGPPNIATSMAGSASWQFGVPQAALDNIVFISNYHMAKGKLPKAGHSSGEESGEETPVLALDAVPKSEAFLKGRHRWPSVDILETHPMSRMLSASFAEQMCRDLGLGGFRTPIMRHRGTAWGIVIVHNSGWKISYSGDTMPCSEFVHAARNSTLMIHEATLDDEHEADAVEKGHSTFSQAVNVGHRAKARQLLLTHFSQRYPRVPLVRSSTNESMDIALGFDLMSIKIGDMWRMQYYRDALEIMFELGEEAAAPETVRPSSPSRYPAEVAQNPKKSKKKREVQNSPVKRSRSPLTSDSSKKSRTDTA